MDDLFEKEYLAKISANYLKVLQGDGGHCPCCKRFGKYNGFTITQKNAQALVWIYKNGGVDDWVNTAKNAPREFMRAKTFTNMRYWGLIEAHPNDRKDVKGRVIGASRKKASITSTGKCACQRKYLFTTVN